MPCLRMHYRVVGLPQSNCSSVVCNSSSKSLLLVVCISTVLDRCNEFVLVSETSKEQRSRIWCHSSWGEVHCWEWHNQSSTTCVYLWCNVTHHGYETLEKWAICPLESKTWVVCYKWWKREQMTAFLDMYWVYLCNWTSLDKEWSSCKYGCVGMLSRFSSWMFLSQQIR